jgi:conflict system STAND superfamily ATPase
MALTSKRKNTPKKPIVRKRTENPDASKELSLQIKAENAVGNIHASSGSEVKVYQRVVKYTPLSEDEQERKRQKTQLKGLKDAIQQKLDDLNELAGRPLSVRSNPYLFLEAFGLQDGPRFFGQQEAVTEVLQQLLNQPTTFLDGIGRTSVLQAGVMPFLLKEGHLPLLVSASKEPLARSVKKQLLPSVETMDFLNEMSMTEFIRRITDELQVQDPEKKLFLLVDQFEALPESCHPSFEQDWALCISGAPAAHWLFSVPSEERRLLNLFKNKVPINQNLVTLLPLERQDAKDTMLRQATLGNIQIDTEVADVILDKLDKPGVNPVQLQVVCYMLAGGKGRLVRHWDMEHYNKMGGVDGILRGYLEQTISELDDEKREPAWQLLSILIDPFEKVIGEASLLERMKMYDIQEELTHATLKNLQDSHLVEYTTAYRLSNDCLIPRIQDWQDKQAARKQAEAEFSRQLLSIGRSGLRGLIGGAIGFTLAYWLLPYDERVPLSNLVTFYHFYLFNLTLRTQSGAFAGFVMILSMDVILASLRGERKRLRIPFAMLAGAIAFSLTLFFHTMLGIKGEARLIGEAKSLVEGAIWGAAAGAGAIWIMQSNRHTWVKVLAVSLLSGLVLASTDLLIRALRVDALFVNIWLSGTLLPLFVLGSALLSKSSLWKRGKL